MRKFAEFVTDEEILQTVSAILSWSHNTHLFDKTNTIEEYLWHATQTIENGWSLSSLEYHTETKTYERQALADKTTNYKSVLSLSQSGLVIDTLKDPYVFDFIEQREGIVTVTFRARIITSEFNVSIFNSKVKFDFRKLGFIRGDITGNALQGGINIQYANNELLSLGCINSKGHSL